MKKSDKNPASTEPKPDRSSIREELKRLRRFGVSDLAFRTDTYPTLSELLASKLEGLPDDPIELLEVCRNLFQAAFERLPSTNMREAAAILFHLERDSEAPPLEERRRAADKAFAGRNVARHMETVRRTLERDIDLVLANVIPRLPALDHLYAAGNANRADMADASARNAKPDAPNEPPQHAPNEPPQRAEPSTARAPQVLIPTLGRVGALVDGGEPAHSLPWLLASVPRQGSRRELRIGTEEVDLLQAAALDLDAIDQRFGGDRLWRSARAHLLSIHYLIEHGIYDEAVGRALQATAGQYTTSLGWFCYDAERHAEARVYFSEALNTAMLSGDDSLVVRTLSNMARQSVDIGKAREAVRFARIARAHAMEWSAPPRVVALLFIREAQGHAKLGDRDSFESSIKKAWREFEQGTTDRDPLWVAFLNEAEIVCLEGMARSDLAQHERAVGLLDQSAQLQKVERSRNRGMCLARLAQAALRIKDLDRTCLATEEALKLVEAGMTSRRNATQLIVVRDQLAPFRDCSGIGAISERLTHEVA